MRRFILLAILLISVLHQSVASASHGLGAHSGHDLAHAALHLEGEPHHHEADGSLHQDNSDESLSHLNAEAASNFPAVASTIVFVVPLNAPAAAAAFLAPAPPSATLETPKRPPRLPA